MVGHCKLILSVCPFLKWLANCTFNCDGHQSSRRIILRQQFGSFDSDVRFPLKIIFRWLFGNNNRPETHLFKISAVGDTFYRRAALASPQITIQRAYTPVTAKPPPAIVPIFYTHISYTYSGGRRRPNINNPQRKMR